MSRNPVKISMDPNSSVQIPTFMNAGMTAILIAIFAYINRNRTRIIEGTVIPKGEPIAK
jgi:hypothetical protein